MAEQTNIEWADSTANFWAGCTKVSPACDHCYAEGLMDTRMHRAKWGPHGVRAYIKQGWADIRKWQRQAAIFHVIHGRRRRVFINSLSDFFDNHKSITWRAEAWDLMRECPDVIFMLLTKLPQNIKKMLPADWGDGWENVWIGCTAENQVEYDRRVPVLLTVPARLRFLSMEPLLGTVRFDDICIDGFTVNPLTGHWDNDGPEKMHGAIGPKIGWIIVGGESGKGARGIDVEAARSIRNECVKTNTPFMMKQMSGETRPLPAIPADLMFRQFPDIV